MDPNVRRRSVVLQTATEEQHHQQQRKRHKVRKQGSSPVIFIWILASCAALTVITYFWISTSTENTTTWATNHVHQIQTPNKRAALQESIHPAREIPGIELEIDGIQVVHPTLSYPARGAVLLLHACTHSALSFFSESFRCPNCIGLSEEMRIARVVLDQGYMPVAVTSSDTKSGCWSLGTDLLRIQKVLECQLLKHYQKIYAIGASSGGRFAAQLLVNGLVQGALVMVSSLNDELVTKLKDNPRPLFLAPMPRDKRTTAVAVENYLALKELNENKEVIVLDDKSCDSLPVTTSYLIERVPKMTEGIANELIRQLKKANHIDNKQMLAVDPTKSNWRGIISPNNSTHFADQFVLKPGFSPLAKALHRAWAFHEYCSEVVETALTMFERNSNNGPRRNSRSNAK